MKRLFAAIMSAAVFGALAPAVDAQSSCPSEVQQAKEMFAKVAKAQDVQAPRTLAGARQDTQAQRSQDVQAPRSLAGARSQDVQAPRGQETQAPRGQETQAPRGQDVQAPRSGQGAGQAVQAPRGGDASKLIHEAEAACKAGNMAEAKVKAEAAIKILK